jgi:hypothetical protein
MNVKNLAIAFIVGVMAAAGAVAAAAQGTLSSDVVTKWVKLGEKDVNHTVDHDTISADKNDHIKEIHLRVMNAPVKFRRVVINYTDGVKQELEFLEDIAVGHESRTITIEGDGHSIKSVDFWYETDSLGGKKAKVAVWGHS